MPYFVYVLEEGRELGQHVKELSDRDDSKLLALALPPYSFEGEFKGNVLQSAIYNAMLNDSSKELSYLL